MAKFKLDDTDHKILDMLIENTRTPFTDIAKKLNRPVVTCATVTNGISLIRSNTNCVWEVLLRNIPT